MKHELEVTLRRVKLNLNRLFPGQFALPFPIQGDVRVSWKRCRCIQYPGRGVQQSLPAVLSENECQSSDPQIDDCCLENSRTGFSLAPQSTEENCKPTLDHRSPLGSRLGLCNVSIWPMSNSEKTGNSVGPVGALQRNSPSGDG